MFFLEKQPWLSSSIVRMAYHDLADGSCVECNMFKVDCWLISDGPIVSVTSDTVRVKQVEERDSFYLVCLVLGSSKLITSFAQSCTWTGHGISANLVEYFEIESEKLQLKVRLYASMLRVGFHEFRCQCNIDLVQYLTNNVVRVQIFSNIFSFHLFINSKQKICL